ncbi:MAG: hypothetical protein IJI43_01780 [Bacilli bacterium]|nr:hypothetical protein [Bacilli bacterium]
MKLKYLSLFTFILALLMLVTTTVKADGFNATREVTGVATSVTNTFTYSVSADSSNPATVTPPSNTTINMQGVTPTGNTATQTAAPLIAESVWTGLNYTKPGTYKFIVSESASSNPSLYPRDGTTYTVHIFVQNTLDGNNVPTGTLTATYVGSYQNGTGSKISKTSNATFTSAAGGTSYISVSNTLKGNDAFIGDTFTYTVSLTDCVAGHVYTIDGGSNPASITIGSDGTGSATITVNHGETVTIGKSGNIGQIPVGAGYSVAQNTGVSGYNTSINGAAGTNTGNLTLAGSSNNADFVNTKTSTTPTGIFFRILPFILLLALSVVGLYFAIRTKEEK